MATLRDRLAEADGYVEEAKRLTELANNIRKEVIRDCPHPYTELEFTSGACSSHLSDRNVYSMRVHCKICNAFFDNQLTVWRD